MMTSILMILTLTASLLLRHYLDFLPGFSGIVFKQGKEGLATLTAAAGIGAMIFSTFLAVRGRTKGLTNFLFVGHRILWNQMQLVVMPSHDRFRIQTDVNCFIYRGYLHDLF